MLAKTILKKYINEDDVQHIIFHHGIVIFKETISTILLLGVCYALYFLLEQYIHWPMLKWIFGGLGIILFIKYVTDVFNKYIDCLILSNDGITIFTWDGIRKHKTEFFEWEKIETISHEKETFGDKIYNKGKITIHLEHEITFCFEPVHNPKAQAKKLLDHKEKKEKESPKEEPKNHEIGDENMAILTEALSEVVKEYLEKKKS